MNAPLSEAMLEPAEFDPFAGAAVERVIPTSEAQREVWLADKLSRDASLAFNESVSLMMRGRLDRRALQGALDSLLVRHDALRATISPDGTELLVNATTGLALGFVDLSAMAESARRSALEKAQSDAVETPFVLEQGPLLRATLYRLGELEHVLLITAHHVVCDGWSWGVMTDDLGALYAEQTGAAPGPDAAASYADYVAWEAAQAGTPEMAEHEKYWLGRFAGSSLPVLDLMPDRPRAAVRSFKARRIDVKLDTGLVADVRKLGAKLGASAFATLFSGFAATLHRLTGQDDLVIGVPAAGQSASGMTDLIGHCVNLLPVRTAVDAAQGFDAFVRQSSTTLLDAFDHQTLTYGSLLKKLPVRRDPSRLPLVSIMFNVDQAIKSSSDAFPELQVEFETNPRHFENFELFVNAAQQSDGGLCLECQYNTDLFDATTIKRWMGAYDALLRSAVADPTRALGRLDWLATRERAALQTLQPTRVARDADALMHSAIQRQCAATPQRVALRHGGAQLSYAELEQRSNRLANTLRARGIRRGERVGLCLSRGIDMVVSLLAVLKAGGTYVPLDPGFPQARLAYYAEDAQLALLLTETAVTTAPVEWRQDAADRILRLDLDRAWLDASADPLPRSALDADAGSTAYIIYTSGSTGKPKGVCLPHAAAANFLASMAVEPGICADDRLAAVTTLSFDIAVLELLLPLTVGAQVVIVPRDTAMDGNLLRELLIGSGATMMQATPGMWRMLLDTPWNGGPGFKALIGGEGLPPDLAHEMLQRCGELWNMYGPTETTVWSTLWNVDRDLVAQRGVSIGRPIANTSVWILDANLQPSPVGVPGEICIGGDGVAQGYLERPELTADRFVPDPFSDVPGARIYRTGDRGRWRNDGLLEHLGRLDFQVKVRGYRIELGEIEAGCNDVAGVTQSVVLAREDNPGDVRLVAYLQLAANAVVDEVGLRAHLRGRLPEYMLPQHVVVLDAIPLLPNGKVDRKALPAPVVTHVARTERVAPRTELERTVATAMQAVLKMPDIGVHDDFFSLGGHSLLAARLIGQLNRDLDVQLSLRTLFESPTVEKLTAAIEQHRGGPALPKREPIQRRDAQDRAPLSLMQERMRFIEEMYPGRVDYNTPSAHRLKGPMNVEAFEQAFNDMLKRQPSLRTRIVATASGFEQLVEDELVVSLLPLEDLSGYPEAERERELKHRNDALMAQTFTLDQAPLFKVRLYKLGEHDHALFFMPHHIIWDGWSFDLLYVEMAANYTARLQQRPTELAPPAVSYGDFAQWHNRWLGSEEIRQQVQYWKDQYAEGGAPREPFADQLREAGSGGVGDTAWIKIDEVQAERIRELAKKTGTTLSIVAMSAFTALMSQWLADRRPVIGLPVRGRPMAELENVMGFFNNMLPMRMPVDMALSGIDWIRSVRQTLLQGYANQDVPFELVAQELEVGRRGAPAKLYHVMFTFQDVRQRPTHWGPLAHSRLSVDLKGVTEDINLWLVDAQDGISGGVRFDTDIYLPQTGAALRDRFIALIDGLVRTPDAPLSTLLAPSLAETERLQAWASPALQPVHALLPAIEAQIAARADAAAVHHGERRFSYRELGAAIAMAERAIHQGAAPTRVVIGVADPFIQLAAALAAWKSGARCWLLDPAADAEVVTQVAAAAHAAVWVADASLHHQAAAARWVDAASLGARSIAAHPARGTGSDTEFRQTPTQGLDPAAVSQTFATLGAQLDLRIGDNVLTLPGTTRGLALAGGLLAVAAGASWRIEQRLEPTRLHELMRNQALVLGGTQDVWQALLEGEHTFGPQTVVALDVRELPAGLVKRLLRQDGRVYSALHADNSGLAVAGGWLTRWQDAGVFGRPLLGLESGIEVSVVSPQTLPVPPGMAGDLGLRDTDGAVQLLGIPCRWRSDGVLQYLGTPENYEPPNVQARPEASAAGLEPELGATERAIADVWTTLLGQDGISRTDNFFELGGTSLMAMQAVTLLEQRLGRRISARRYVFDSLGQLAAAYDEAAPNPAPAAAANDAPAADDAAPKGLFKRLAGLVRRS